MPVVIAAAALLGLAVGSFLNVVIYRLPAGLSLATPASHCPRCEQPVRARHNVPVLGWLVLQGRCADCRSPISPRYPIVEAFTCASFVAVAIQLARLDERWALPAFLYFAAIGIALAMIDVDTHRLPNAIVLPSYLILGLALTLAAVLADTPAALVRALIGGMALFGLYFVMAWCYPSGMGFGDVKLAGLIGGMLGYLSFSALLVGAFAGFLLGSLYAMAALVSGRASLKTAVPYGPFMLLGAFVAIFASSPIASLYTSTVLGG